MVQQGLWVQMVLRDQMERQDRQDQQDNRVIRVSQDLQAPQVL